MWSHQADPDQVLVCHLLCDLGENSFSEPPLVVFFEVQRIAAAAAIVIRAGDGASQPSPAELRVEVAIELPSRDVCLEFGLGGEKWDMQRAQDRSEARLARGGQQRA